MNIKEILQSSDPDILKNTGESMTSILKSDASTNSTQVLISKVQKHKLNQNPKVLGANLVNLNPNALSNRDGGKKVKVSNNVLKIIQLKSQSPESR